MDDLLREFLTETGERLDFIDAELVRFEREPDDGLLRNIFRLVHTIKGTCGFLGLPRLESLAHAAESLMDRFREGMPVTPEAVGIVLATIDRLKEIMAVLDQTGVEPEGTDSDLVAALDRASSSADETSPVEPVREEPAPAGEPAVTPAPAEAPSHSEPETAVAPGASAAAAEPDAKPGEGASEARRGGAAQVQTIRVGVETLEHLMTMVSELVLTRNQLLEISRRQDDPAYKVPLQRLSYVTAELQEGVMKTRMQPIGSAWQKLPRIVRDLAAELGKPIDLLLQGAETELDRQLLEVIKDPLTHMIRNSADHGLETPLERRAAGKPERGTIRLSASHEGGTIIIEIEDDGRGLDFASIRRKALQRGIASEAELERMTDAQVSAFVFHPGFSTAAAVTAVSGRGVGLDVVKTNIELIGGTVEIRSEPGCGTTFSVKIPLTLAIVSALIVSVGGQRLAIPQVAVLELVRVRAGSEEGIERLNGAPVLRVRDRLLPIVRIADLLGLSADERGADHGFVVVTQVGRQRFGLLVDGLFHTEEIVVKPMGSKLRQVPFFSGHTILGDGAVVLILDPNGVARTLRAGADKGKPWDRKSTAEIEVAPEQPRIPLLVFRAGGRQLKAVPLSLVTRLEEIDAETIEWAADRALVQYRGRLMPLVPAGPGLQLRERGPQPLVVFSDGTRSIGVAVDDIVDIVEDVLEIQLMAERPDLIGSAVIRGRATEIVDVTQYLPAAPAGASAHGRSGTGRTVLLVENSPFVREMLAAVMRASGHHVIAPERPEEALATAERAARIDAVVADLDGAGQGQGAGRGAATGGFALVEAIRQHPRLGQAPVIGVASTVSRDAVDRARSLGVTDFVQKFDRAGLLSALAEAVSPSLEEAA